MKNTRDIKNDPEKARINLRGNKQKDPQAEDLTHKNPRLYKHNDPINPVQDIKNDQQAHYAYLKGKKYRPPKYLDNILKMLGVGFLIIFIFNSIGAYITGRAIQADLQASAESGYNYLLSGGKEASKVQFDAALKAFNSALDNFEKAENDLWFISQDNSFYAEENKVGSAITGLIEGGQHFSIAGQHFLAALEELNKIPLYFVSKNSGNGQKSPSITDTLKVGLAEAEKAFDEIQQAAEKTADIDPDDLPAEISSRVRLAKEKISEISDTLQTVSEHFPALLKLLGDRYPHRYLILLQNNNEIRPTGGFIGSYAIIDVNDGYIENLTVHDVYDIDGSYGGIIEPPEEFLPFTSNWRFRDSNYSPDFTYSAKKARWFLEKQGGPSVDTVIAINQGLLRDFMEITGPIQVGDFGQLNSKNYNLLLSYVIEGKIWGPENPKHILKVFIPAFKEAILQESNLPKIGSKLLAAVQKKHIMMYSADEDIQALFDAIGTSGRVHQSAADEDYLSVINIATGGTKSEQFMQEEITHHTEISRHGDITNTVVLKRSHLWSDAIYFEWKEILASYGFDQMPDWLIDILGRGRNKVSTRIYVPDGAILLEASDNSITTKYDKDLNKTYFFTRMNVAAGDSQEIWIKYSIPYQLDLEPTAPYKLVVDKQPGSIGSIFTKTLSVDPKLQISASHPLEAKLHLDGTSSYATNLAYDRYYSVLIED